MQEGRTPSTEAAAARRRIGRRIIALHKEFFGRGPVGGKVYVHDDSVLVLLNEGHTRAEETLEAARGGEEVASQRLLATAGIERKLMGVVEEETGRSVASFMSTSKQQPSLIAYVFVLEPNQVLNPGGAGL